MLEFDQSHKVVNTSSIKNKVDKAKRMGKVKVAGILLASVLLLSGCASIREIKANKEFKKVSSENQTQTAFFIDGNNATIMDVVSADDYKRYTDSFDRRITIKTKDGDRYLVDSDSVQFVIGENSHEMAKILATNLLGEDAFVVDYDENIQSLLNEQSYSNDQSVETTVIYKINNNIILIDALTYEDSYITVKPTVGTFSEVARRIIIKTTNGYKIDLPLDKSRVFDGVNSHEKALIVAQTMVGDGGEIFDYNEFIKSNSLSR